jgi:hypothetical protein
MIRTGLDFDPRTTDDCKKLVVSLFTPTEIYSAYRAARAQLGTGDLVVTLSEQDPSGFEAVPRAAYIAAAKSILGPKKQMPIFMRGLVVKSAQGVMELPSEEDAMWLIVVRGTDTVPVMCVLYAIAYEVEETEEAAVN